MAYIKTECPSCGARLSLILIRSFSSALPFYAAGYQEAPESEYHGMFAGPSPNLTDITDIVPNDPSRTAYIFHFDESGGITKIREWRDHQWVIP